MSDSKFFKFLIPAGKTRIGSQTFDTEKLSDEEIAKLIKSGKTKGAIEFTPEGLKEFKDPEPPAAQKVEEAEIKEPVKKK